MRNGLFQFHILCHQNFENAVTLINILHLILHHITILFLHKTTQSAILNGHNKHDIRSVAGIAITVILQHTIKYNSHMTISSPCTI